MNDQPLVFSENQRLVIQIIDFINRILAFYI